MKNTLLKQTPGLVAFGLIFLLYICYLPTTTYDYLPWDSGGYWRLGEKFFKNGHFSFFNFNSKLRGYLYPLINLPFYLFWKKTGIELFIIVKVLGALLAGVFWGIVAPKLWETLCPTSRIGLWKRLVFALLGFLFWRDYFNFTLSDFPAVLLFSTCLILLFRKPQYQYLVLAGVLYGATINFRPSYLISAPFLLLTVFLIPEPKKSAVVSLLRSFAIGVGFLIISMPQILINVAHYQKFSPLITSEVGEHKRNLYLSQLEWGLEIQKYESSLDKRYPSSQLIYIDPVGHRIIRENNLKINLNIVPDESAGTIQENKGLQDFGHYFRLVFSNPLSFALIYLRHLFNGLDLQFATPYIQDVFEVHYLLMLANYSVWFAALLLFSFRIIPTLNRQKTLALVLFLLPGLLAIPTAIECRYLLPFHLLAYGVVAFAWPAGWWQSLRPNRKFALLAGYLIFVLACFYISAQMQQTLQLQPRFLF